MERRDLRAVDPSIQAVVRDDHDLSALLHAGERHHVPRVAEDSGVRSGPRVDRLVGHRRQAEEFANDWLAEEGDLWVLSNG